MIIESIKPLIPIIIVLVTSILILLQKEENVREFWSIGRFDPDLYFSRLHGPVPFGQATGSFIRSQPLRRG